MKLKQQILQHITQGEGDFNSLALAVFAYQFEHCQPYQHYCRQLEKTPEQISEWQDIPAVSTEVFREFDLTTLPKEQALFVFQTSGTSQEKKGRHYYHDLELYDAAIQNSFMKGLGLSTENKTQFRVLTPSFKEVSTSSLFYMFEKVLEWYGREDSQFYFEAGELNAANLLRDLQEDGRQNRPVVLLGTAFSWVNFLDYLQEKEIKLSLPRGSRLLETGGLKGRSRTVSRVELYQAFQSELGLEASHCFSEYGMTELSSQSYSEPDSHLFQSPAWMPVTLIDPHSGKAVKEGETGLVQFFDLANLTAVSAVITSDLARKRGKGFELIGRAPKAVLRGCSTAFEK